MASRVLAVVTALVLLGGCTDDEGADPTGAAPTAEAADPPGPVDQQQVFDDVTAANRAAAIAWSEEVVGTVVLPPGSARLDREPRIFRRGLQVGSGPSDRGLTRTAWWTVPTSLDELSRFLLSHHPPGHTRYPGTGIGGPDGSPHLDYDGASPDPDAFTGTTIGVEWRQGAGVTFVRAKTFLLARGLRDPVAAVVPPVERVRIGYVQQRTWPRTRLETRRWEGDDPEVRRLLRSLDGLPASAVPPPFGGCLPQTAGQEVRIRIDDAAGTWRGVVRAPYCSGQLVVRRDGEETVGTLDPWTLTPVVDALFHD